MEKREYTEDQLTVKLYKDQMDQIDSLRWGLRYESRAELVRDILDLGLDAILYLSEKEDVDGMEKLKDYHKDLLGKS